MQWKPVISHFQYNRWRRQPTKVCPQIRCRKALESKRKSSQSLSATFTSATRPLKLSSRSRGTIRNTILRRTSSAVFAQNPSVCNNIKRSTNIPTRVRNPSDVVCAICDSASVASLATIAKRARTAQKPSHHNSKNPPTHPQQQWLITVVLELEQLAVIPTKMVVVLAAMADHRWIV